MSPTRRDFAADLLRVLALPGAAAFLQDWRAAAQTHSPHIAPPETDRFRDYHPKFFTADDFAALEAFTEILIPTDDAPGARQAHCAHFIDFLLANSEEDAGAQRLWRKALDTLRSLGFHAAGPEQQLGLVEAMSKPEHDRGATHPGYAAYRMIKQLNAFAFYTSRAGMIEALDYRGNSYNVTFPACTHPEHQVV